MLSITLAVEDVLSERVILRMLTQVRRDLSVTAILGSRGNAYLRGIARGLNKAAQGSGFFLLTDQDNAEHCPIDIITEWLGGDERHANFLFRVAVFELEGWLLADRGAMAEFLSVPLARLPEHADKIADPKQFLVNLARSSNRSNIRDDLVPKPRGTAKVGPNYNGRLAEFIEECWSCKRARNNSASLRRAVQRLEDFSVVTKPTGAAR